MAKASRARVLHSLAEVQETRYIDLEATFKKEEYTQTIKEYEIYNKDDWLRCHFIKNNLKNKCNQLHGHGWIVEIKSGKRVLIGCECQKKYFDSNDSFTKDIIKYQNDTARLERIDRGREILGDKAKLIHSINDAHKSLNTIKSTLNDFEQAMGPQLVRRFKSQAHNSGAMYLTMGFINEDWLDWKRNTKNYIYEPTQFERIDIKLCTLRALELLDGRVLNTEKRLVRDEPLIRSIFEDDADISDSLLNSLPVKVQYLNQALKEVEDLKNLFSAFIENDFRLCSLLSRNKQNRRRILLWASSLQNIHMSTSEADNLIQDSERKLLAMHEADHIVG